MHGPARQQNLRAGLFHIHVPQHLPVQQRPEHPALNPAERANAKAEHNPYLPAPAVHGLHALLVPWGFDVL